jgi:hypothetical protein
MRHALDNCVSTHAMPLPQVAACGNSAGRLGARVEFQGTQGKLGDHGSVIQAMGATCHPAANSVREITAAPGY